MKKAATLLVVFGLSMPAMADIIDFELGGASFLEDALIPEGVTSFVDSDPTTGSTFLNDTNALNGPTNTPISGQYANVGAFDDTATEIDIRLNMGTAHLGFDWATGAGAKGILVSTFDVNDDPIDISFVASDSTFFNDAGIEVPGGSYSFDVPVGELPIVRIVIEDQPGAIRALSIDNLSIDIPGFDPNTDVPEPTSAAMLGAVFVGLASVFGRKRIA